MAAGRASDTADGPWRPLGGSGSEGWATGSWVGSDPSDVHGVYTRGNAGEVYPEVFTPLTFSLVAERTERAFRNALLTTGLVRPDEFADIPLTTALGTGVFGGYVYLNLSTQRLIAARFPGGSAADADTNYLGVGQAPPHRPAAGERNLRASLAGLGYVLSVLRTRELPDLDRDRAEVDALLASLADPGTASDRRLRDDIDRVTEVSTALFETHLVTTGAAGLAFTVLSQLCGRRLGDASLAVQLLAGLGEVDSAAPSTALWELSRLVVASPDLAARFDRGVDDDLWTELQNDPAAAEFVPVFLRFLADFGSRGPNEWDTAFDTWETRPALALTLIDRMRHADPGSDPRSRLVQLGAETETLVASLVSGLRGPERRILRRVLQAARVWSRGRERSKTTVVRAIHGARLASMELDRRLAATGGGRRGDLWFVIEPELDAYLTDPAAFADVITARRRVHAELNQRIPPFVFDRVQPPPDSWERRDVSRRTVTVGEILTGLPGCRGINRGRARVVLDPADPRGLAPGDVLIAPITDPSWTPLFVAAKAVVVDVGAVMSHAVIVSRELGLPCVVSVTDATRRIPDGALIEVDGTAGTVTVLDLGGTSASPGHR